MIVAVRHPAAVVRVPAKARRERVDLVAVTTPVALRAMDIADLEPVRLDFSDQQAFSELYRGEGALWRPIDPTTGITADRLARWLAGPEARETVLEIAFAGTPLLARPDPLLPGRSMEALRGGAIDVDGSRAISRDDRTRAASAVSAYLDANVRVVGGYPFRRSEPLLRYTPGWGEAQGPRLELADRRGLGTLRTVVATPATHAGLRAFARDFPWPRDTERAEEILAAGLDAILAGADARRAVDDMPSLARRHLDLIGRQGQGGTVSDGASRVLRGLEVDALTGLGGLEDPERSLRALARVFDEVAALEVNPAWTPGRFQRRALRMHYLPGLLTQEIDADDVEALSALR